jgi:hypothetical protein
LKHFITIKIFYGEGVVSPTPNPKAGGPPLVGCLTAYSIYLRLPSVTGALPSICNLRTRDPPNMDVGITNKKINNVLSLTLKNINFINNANNRSKISMSQFRIFHASEVILHDLYTLSVNISIESTL